MNEPAETPGPGCPECGAASSPGSKFCESCGVSLASRTGAGPEADAEPRARRAPRRRRSRAPADRVEKVEIQRTLSRARRQVRSIRLFCWFGATGYVVYGLVLLLLASRGGVDALVEPAGAAALRTVAYALWGTGAVLVVGALSIHRQPFAWTVGLAGFQTLITVLGLALGSLPILEIIVTLGFWGSAPLMARASRILREHGDEYSSEHLVRRVGRDVAESEARQHAAERRRRGRRQRLRSLGLVGAVAVAVIIGGYFLFQLATASATLESRLAVFEQAWESTDFDGVESMCTRDYRFGSWPRAERILEREGWDSEAPPLGEPSVVSRTDLWAEVHFALPVGTMRTKWVQQGSSWALDGIIFNKIRSGR